MHSDLYNMICTAVPQENLLCFDSRLKATSLWIKLLRQVQKRAHEPEWSRFHIGGKSF